MKRKFSKEWMSRGLVGILATIGLVFASSANAVPCSPIIVSGGILPSTNCKDGPDGDTADSAADLNAGSYFGSSSWTLLDNTIDGVDGNIWSFSGGSPNGQYLGVFDLANGIWSGFSKLAVVLNGRGGLFDSDVKWSAYLLPNGNDGIYLWSYDIVHKLKNASIYGVIDGNPTTVRVPEPATLAVFCLALAVGGLVLRRRLATIKR